METIRRDLHRLRGCVLVEVEYTIKDIKDGGNVTGIYYHGEKNSTYSRRHRGTRSKLRVSFELTAREGPRTSKPKKTHNANYLSHFEGLKQRELLNRSLKKI